MEKILLRPYFDVKPWGGDLLANIFGCKPHTGEAWIVSTIPSKESYIVGGDFDNKPLSEYIKTHHLALGLDKNEDFPVLIKLLDAKESLSIQVHPDDEYAISKGFHNGKYECWYVLDETTTNKVIFGIKKVDRSVLEKSIIDGKLEQYLNYKEIKKHDLLKVVPGTVHAIVGGSFFLEVQDPCDITYRLYDYNRLPKRELHIEDSLNVIYKKHKPVDLEKYSILDRENDFIIRIKNYNKFYFLVEKKTYKTYLIIL